uniref:Serine kinase n=1 Tax=candidate division WOR-3 bacterium TaxID=2052148 RepID=A0A7C2PK56_UNCW3
MKLSEVVKVMGLKIFNPEVEGWEMIEVSWGYASDLLSDVIAGLSKDELWVTIQRHLNVVAVAKLKDGAGIVITKGIIPDDATIKKATEEGVVLLGTEMNTFEFCGKLYNLLKYGEIR